MVKFAPNAGGLGSIRGWELDLACNSKVPTCCNKGPVFCNEELAQLN